MDLAYEEYRAELCFLQALSARWKPASQHCVRWCIAEDKQVRFLLLHQAFDLGGFSAATIESFDNQANVVFTASLI